MLYKKLTKDIIWEYKSLGINEWEAYPQWLRTGILNLFKSVLLQISVFIAKLAYKTCSSRSFSLLISLVFLCYTSLCNAKLWIFVGEEWNKVPLKLFFHLSILTLKDESEDTHTYT